MARPGMAGAGGRPPAPRSPSLMESSSTAPATSLSPTGSTGGCAASMRARGSSPPLPALARRPIPAVAGRRRRPGSPSRNGRALDAEERRLYIADVADHRVRIVDLASGVIDTFAGTGAAEHSGDGGPVRDAGIFGARAVRLGPDGTFYILERQGSSL